MTVIGESLKGQKLLVWLRWPDCLWIAPVGEGAGGVMKADQHPIFEWLIFIGL